MVSERITGKKFGIECRSIKSSIAKKSLGLINGCFKKKSFRVGIKSLESWTDLSSSGESDFFSTVMSGWEAIKFVIKSDMPDDSKTVGNDAKFEDITEMPIDV